MRYIKRLSLNSSDPFDTSFAVQQNGRIITKTDKGIQIPNGTTGQRSDIPVNGEFRYNTSINNGTFEAYINGAWTIVKTNTQSTITQNTFTASNYSNTIFGPLSYTADISKPQNVMVYIENVYQIPTTNYTLLSSTVGNPLSTTATVTLSTGSEVTVLQVDSTINFEPGNPLIGANLTGNTIQSVTTTSITISPGTFGSISLGQVISTSFAPGTYINFTSGDIPAPSKPITVLQGFDGYGPPFAV